MTEHSPDRTQVFSSLEPTLCRTPQTPEKLEGYFTGLVSSLFWEEKTQSLAEAQVTFSVEIRDSHVPPGGLGRLTRRPWGLAWGRRETHQNLSEPLSLRVPSDRVL